MRPGLNVVIHSLHVFNYCKLVFQITSHNLLYPGFSWIKGHFIDGMPELVLTIPWTGVKKAMNGHCPDASKVGAISLLVLTTSRLCA